MDPSPSLPPPLPVAAARRGALAILAFVAAVAVVVLVVRLVAGGRAPLPTGDAEWIWAAVPRDRAAPEAFFVATDVELAAVPQAAELLAVADEEYVIYLNGHRVGSNTYSLGAPLDVYEVGSLLRRGANRLAVELRSGRGAGGLLACLRDRASGRTLAATGRDWRVAAEQLKGLAEARPLADLPPASSWGRPPAGRWGEPARGPVRPLFDRAVAAGDPQRAERYALLGRPLEWRPADDLLAGDGGAPGVLLDWGREVEGYLNLRTGTQEPRPAALLFVAGRPLDPLAGLLGGVGGSAGDGFAAGVPAIAVPGRRNWTDTVPRRFRYAAVVALRGLDLAWVEPLVGGDERAAGLPQPPPAPAAERGVFGLVRPALRSPVENEVRRELQRLANLAGGKGG